MNGFRQTTGSLRSDQPAGLLTVEDIDLPGRETETLRSEPAGAPRRADNRSAETREAERLIKLNDDAQMRIGADLHDGLGQHLTGIACLAASLRELLESDHPVGADKAGRIAELINQALDLTRSIAHGLYPAQVLRHGLDAALTELASTVTRIHAIKSRFEARHELGIFPPEMALQLYRIAQEAISNAIRHGRAREIVVCLEGRGRCGRLAVEDDGCGFDPDVESAGGIGLHLMTERAKAIGAALRVVPQERGTRVECLFSISS